MKKYFINSTHIQVVYYIISLSSLYIVIIDGHKCKLTMQSNVAYEKLSNKGNRFDHTYESIP